MTRQPAGQPALVELVSAFPFWFFRSAALLAEQGALQRLHTTYPARYVPSVPADRVRSRPWLAAPYRVVSRRVPRAQPALARLVITDFDRWATAHLDGAPVVVGCSGAGTRALLHARDRGAAVVCGRGSWHILEQQEVLRRESERWGVPMPHFDPFFVERELTEYAIADRIIVPSTTARRSFERRGFGTDRVEVIPFGADLAMFTPGGAGERRDGSVVCIGSVGIRKGQPRLLRAYRRVRTTSSELRIIGPLDPHVGPLLDAAGAGDPDVEIVGPVPKTEVAAHLRRASIFALASVEEGLALVIAEAMAAGLAIVATDATGAEDILESGREGLIVPAGDEEALAAALGSLLEDPARVRAMGEAAREKVRGLGGWDAFGRQQLDLLRSLAPGGYGSG